ncbi:hypothetical protein WHT83_06240 [Aminobacter sp. P9b]|uniref:hypothetical protein n=1 Tax=Aminobacter sp. P9b TaxID=3133697 RepID=UPI00324332C4
MPLHVNGLALAESKRTLYRITTGIDDTPDSLLDPRYWVHVAKQLRVDDRLEVMAFDRSWFAEILVVEVGAGGFGGARMAMISVTLLTNQAEIEKPAENEVRWGGPKSKWQAVRITDKKVLQDGFETKDEAADWIAERSKLAA